MKMSQGNKNINYHGHIYNKEFNEITCSQNA